MFHKQKLEVVVDDEQLVVTELPAKRAMEIGKLSEWDGTCRAIMEMVSNTDGSPRFVTTSEVDNLPTHVIRILGEAIKKLSEPKN